MQAAVSQVRREAGQAGRHRTFGRNIWKVLHVVVSGRPLIATRGLCLTLALVDIIVWAARVTCCTSRLLVVGTFSAVALCCAAAVLPGLAQT